MDTISMNLKLERSLPEAFRFSIDWTRHNAAGSAFIALLALWALWALYSLYLHPLAKFPGPKLWAVSRVPWVGALQAGRLHRRISQLHARYGLVVRVAPDEISVISDDVWQTIYTQPRPSLIKDPYSQAQPLNGGHSLFTAEGDTHKRIRGNVVSGLSDRVLKDQSSIIVEHADEMISRLERLTTTSPCMPVNVWTLLGDMTVNIISTLVLGEPWKPPGQPTSEDLNDFVVHARFSTLMNSLSRWPPLKFAFIFLYFRLGAELRMQTWKMGLEKITRRLERKDNTNANGGRPDFVAPLVKKIRDGDTGGITVSEFQSNVLSFMFADSLLTSVTLTTILHFLAKSPEIVHNVRTELHETLRDPKYISIQSVQDLPYLNAVINESLRLQHPTPISLPRILRERMILANQTVPKSYIVSTNLHAIQTTASHWVAPSDFRPARFLPAGHPLYSSAYDEDNKTVFKPFSCGPRNCVGANVFLHQARVLLAKLVWNFDMALDESVPSDWLNQKAYLIFEPGPLLVKFTKLGTLGEKTGTAGLS